MDLIIVPFFALDVSFLDPKLTSDKKPYGPARYNQIVKECYLISKNCNTSYADLMTITPHERKLLLNLIAEEIKRSEEQMARAKAEREASLELGDLEEANLLLAEAEAADSEAKELEPIYNFKMEEIESLPKHFMSLVLISNLGRKQLEELAASVQVPPA